MINPTFRTCPTEPILKKDFSYPATTGTERKIKDVYNRVGGLLTGLADMIDIPVSSALAILMAESNGAGFRNGRMVIRFEVHWFWKKWGKKYPHDFDLHFSFNRNNRSWLGHRCDDDGQGFFSFHGNQDKEWRVFNFACSLDAEAACQSTSFGGPQIMGFNHARCGYPSAAKLYEYFKSSERWHILGLFDYFQTDNKIMAALQQNDFWTVAYRYNGSGQADNYAAIIRRYKRKANEIFGQD
jgi:hypothetical protein